MTEETLSKFIKEYDVPYYWQNTQVCIELYHFLLENLTDLLTYGFYDDGVHLPAFIYHGFIMIEMKDICSYYDINMEKVFPKKEGE